MHSSATAHLLRTISRSYLCNKSKPNCLKQLENRLIPTRAPPPQIENTKNSCSCQASTEYTAFHFIKTITQKPAKNYIKLPPCTTPSPFSSTLLPNTQNKQLPNSAKTQPHQSDTAPEKVALKASHRTGYFIPRRAFLKPKQHNQKTLADPNSLEGL